MASVNFYLDKERNKKTLILIVFTFHHERLRLSTGISIPKKNWDDLSQTIKPAQNYTDENKKLRDIKSFLIDKHDDLFPVGASLSRTEVKQKAEKIKKSFRVYTGRKKADENKTDTLISYISVFQEHYKHKYNPVHLVHYNGLKGHLEKFQETKDFRVDFETITKNFYLQFTDYLQECGLKPNTIGSHIKMLKRVMNEAFEDNLTTNQEFKKREFKTIKEEVDSVYLSTKEIMDLYSMNIDNSSKRRIRDFFVLNCFTGLRHSDWNKVSFENLHDNKLYITTQKTKEPVIIPVKPIVIEILNRYGSIQAPTLQKTNDAMLWIGENAAEKEFAKSNSKKWLKIRTHTARRSFATNAYLAGIPMRDIMQITGHRTTESFLKYIRVTKLETAEKLKDHPFFS